jgi:hypothetical protein
MTTPDEYREYSRECLKWADEAKTDDIRQSFLDMARDCTLAAMRLEGVLIPQQAEQTSGRHSSCDAASVGALTG